ncbi:enoyl-CoA hydratase [Meridianimarinicoccus roseus]|uniref:Enoyl-CoA hydratase n=1 Tax=Meridianimarinicoccus roseus TaxID=2072018 RepID=A0A2V2LBF2_9RHOB|nr:enoyl-CoA hydratase/isomerase family protein [Meridianimarinicoccus roseus]PWR02830.1 enoyl-CoA hydratase [Meridianimarinicoccus roseus]
MIRTEREGALWRAVIDRPDKANSLTGEMLAELADFAEAAQGHANVLVLTGTGRVFSAGADLEAAKAGLATDPVWERLSGAIARFDGLSIAALNGTLAGGAFGMALACDLRIAVEGAKFFYPVMKLGFLPQPSDPPRLVALVGPARARLILMGAAKLTAAEALAHGLVDRVVAADGLAPATAELAEAALGAAPAHVTAIKALTRPG